MNQLIDINDLAEDLGLRRQTINYHIIKGRAGDIEKEGDTFTSRLLIPIKNALQLIGWISVYGRGNKLKLKEAKDRYETILNMYDN